MTPSEVDHQYNPSAWVSDPDACMRQYARDAAEACATLQDSSLNVSYGLHGDETLNIFPPASGQKDAPVFVFVHGGYWRALHANDFNGVALGPGRSGMLTVVLNYSLCPAVSILEIVAQVNRALRWVQQNIHRYGGDGQRIALAGHSAGAHLAAMAVLMQGQAGALLSKDSIHSALLISGLYELAPLEASYLQPFIRLDAHTIASASPVRWVAPSTTRLWVTWGELESPAFAQQSQGFADRWRACANTATVEALPGHDHFSAINPLCDPGSTLTRWLCNP